MQLSQSEDIEINSDSKTMQNGQSENIESLILMGKLCKSVKVRISKLILMGKLCKMVKVRISKVEFWRETYANYGNWSKLNSDGKIMLIGQKLTFLA